MINAMSIAHMKPSQKIKQKAMQHTSNKKAKHKAKNKAKLNATIIANMNTKKHNKKHCKQTTITKQGEQNITQSLRRVEKTKSLIFNVIETICKRDRGLLGCKIRCTCKHQEYTQKKLYYSSRHWELKIGK